MDLSIVIINYNTSGLTAACINSLTQNISPKIEYEILLVDNGSVDFNKRSFRLLNPFLKIIPNDTNLGFGRANNLAMKSSIGDYILLLNSDTILLEESINGPFQLINENVDIDVLGIKQIREDKTELVPRKVYFKEENLKNYILNIPILNKLISFKKSIGPNSKKTLKVNHLSGAYMLLKIKVF
mgnify:FL=1